MGETEQLTAEIILELQLTKEKYDKINSAMRDYQQGNLEKDEVLKEIVEFIDSPFSVGDICRYKGYWW